MKTLLLALTCLAVAAGDLSAQANPPQARRPQNDEQLRYWLENMVGFHQFSTDEVAAATGLSPTEINDALTRFSIRPGQHAPRRDADALIVLPYPGGRHPRIGFLDGAVMPQRETKISIFTPWDPSSYVVADIPEAIWSNLGLTYLAHTHVPTIWTKEMIELQQLEWNRGADGTLNFERKLPNGIRFGTKVTPTKDSVRMEMWITNGTEHPLSGLRVQNCVMLKGARGFTDQTNENKRFESPYACCRAQDTRRWIISAWEGCQRAWGNAPCPCLHSDPEFPPCDPGKTVKLRGRLSFFEGDDVSAELQRIERTLWRQVP